jgi:hypothetical protein
MKKYYATGNVGYGRQVFSFNSKKARNNFLAWGKADNRRFILAKDAKKEKHITSWENETQAGS